MLVQVSFTAIGTTPDENGHYHNNQYTGIMTAKSMQELQALIVVSMANKGNQKAGLPEITMEASEAAPEQQSNKKSR